MGKAETRRAANIWAMINKKMEKAVSAIHVQMGTVTRLARTIPARKRSENHRSGSREVKDSGMRPRLEGFAACIVLFMIA
jgi:hypothetical protein